MRLRLLRVVQLLREFVLGIKQPVFIEYLEIDVETNSRYKNDA